MNTWIATWPRRLSWAALGFVLCLSLVLLWAHASTQSWSLGDIMSRILALPSLFAIALLALLTACHHPNETQAAPTAVQSATPSSPFRAQVVGLEWLNPLMWRDYPTEWNLLWTLGLVKPNADDDEVKDDPELYAKIGPVREIATNLYKKRPFDDVLILYAWQLVDVFGPGYVMNPHYFYTVKPHDRKQWRELHGMHIEFAIPVTNQLSAEEAAKIMRDSMDGSFQFHDVPDLSTANIPADVHVTAGGANAGFTSLSAAMDYLEAHPDKSVWVINWDSPEFPKDNSLAENCTLLILAGPNMNTEREPLAWIGRPATHSPDEFETKERQSKSSQAWKASLVDASTHAGVKPLDLGYVIHDAGMGTPAAGERLGKLGQTLTESLPELNYQKQTFNTAQVLGDMRAGSALTNLALAIAWAHHKGQPVLVAGTHELNQPVMVVVTPPAKPRPFDPNKPWMRARGEGGAYRPWWGLRKDANLSEYDQGESD